MKKILLLVLINLALFSCSDDENSITRFSSEALPIENIVFPTEFLAGETYSIEYTYIRPSTCYVYSNLYYKVEENTRTIAVINLVANNPNCQLLDDFIIERSFNFIVTQAPGTSYTFKIWKGLDNNNDDVYETYYVPVVVN